MAENYSCVFGVSVKRKGNTLCESRTRGFLAALKVQYCIVVYVGCSEKCMYTYTLYILHDSSAFGNVWRSGIRHSLICQFSSLYEAV